MRVRDQGFALMLVLIAAAGAFALAAQASLTIRANMTEASAAVDRADAQRRARSAAVVALTGLLTPAAGFDEGASPRERIGAGGGRGSGARGPSSPVPIDENELELPAIVKELLGGALKEVEKEQEERDERREDLQSRNGGLGADAALAGADRSLGIGYRQLERFGLPPAPVEVSVPGDDATYTIEFADAVGLLDINTAEERQLTTYLTLKGVESGRAQAIAQQILDWRDEDEFVRPLGAERDNYAGSGIEIANARFTALEQLLYMPSMTREIYAMIRRDVILEGTGVHVNSAPLEVLASVEGMNVAFATSILETRALRPITENELRAMAPPAARGAMGFLRTRPTNLVRLRVVMEDEGVRVFEGYALLDDSSVRAVTLSPTYDLVPERTP
ncbi:MAG: type II secretion system protein GspK [Phycisphaerales bacterium]